MPDLAPKIQTLTWDPHAGELKYAVGRTVYIARGLSPFHKEKVDSFIRHGANGRAINYLKAFDVERVENQIVPRREFAMNIAQELIRTAKLLVSEDFNNVILTVLSSEGGKYYSEGKYPYRDVETALRNADDYVKEGYEVVVWSGDYIIARSNGISERDAMRYGTGTVNRLTKRAEKFYVIH